MIKRIFLKKTTAYLLIIAIMNTMFLFFSLPVLAKSPNLRLAAISDVHITSSDGKCEGGIYFKKALQYYKKRGVDVVLIAGDIANDGKDYQTRAANAIFNEVFGNTIRPTKMFVPGNHDRYSNKTFTQMAKDFATNFEEAEGAYIHKVINGYDFIGVSLGGDSSTLKTFVKKALEKAVKRDPNKPIFFTEHEHISGTVYGSENWGDSTLYSILKSYPQVVTFSGHSHFTLIDDRSIHQRDFTSIGTSTLKYMELEYGKENGSVPPKASNVKEGLYLEVFDDEIEVERHSFFYDEQLGANWQLKLPLTKDSFVYKDDRSKTAVAPTFKTNDKIEVRNIKKNGAKIAFNSAMHENFVHSYAIESVNSSTGAKSEKMIFSDFYLGTGRMSEKIDYNLTGLVPDNEYIINVYAIESFGKRSKPLTATIKTLSANITVDKFTPTVLDVNFMDNTLSDSTYNKTEPDTHGTPKVIFDTELNKFVLALDGKSYVNYYVPNDEVANASDIFTIETVFKMNAIKNQTVIENTDGAGFGFESTESGYMELWSHIGGSYKKIGVQLQKDKYYHLLGTYNGSEMSLYLDGKLVDSIKVSGAVRHPQKTPIALGADPNPSGGGDLLFDGNIALARIYAVAMNQQDVEKAIKNYREMLTGTPITAKVTIKYPQNGMIELFSDEEMKTEITDYTKLKKGDLVFIKATANDDYELDKITINGEMISTKGFVVNVNSEISAIFKKKSIIKHKVTIAETDGGKIELFYDSELKTKAENLLEIVPGTKLYIKVIPVEKYYNNTIAINGVKILENFFLVNDNILLDATFVCRGDANGDKTIDTRDSLTILKHIAQIKQLNSDNMLSADFNRDNIINTLDSLEILKSIVFIV